MLSNPLTFTLADSWLWLKLSTCKGVQAESTNCSVFLHFFNVMLCINNNGSSEILSKVDSYYDYTHSSWKVYFVWVNQSSNIRILHESVSLLTFASCMSQSVFLYTYPGWVSQFSYILILDESVSFLIYTSWMSQSVFLYTHPRWVSRSFSIRILDQSINQSINVFSPLTPRSNLSFSLLSTIQFL